MTTEATIPAGSRPVTVSVAVGVIYAVALLSAALGILVLLSRYQVEADDVLLVSLLGAGIILFGLLLLAVGGGVARGSAGSRIIISCYLGLLLVLQIVTIVTTDGVDWWAIGQIVLGLLILAALWLPPGSRWFSR